jgi:hypothetical protein
MADPTVLPPEPALPELPGGRTRPSVLIAVDRFPTVARRLDLNQRLLARTCPYGGADESLQVTADDLDLLLLAVQERFGAEAALIRHQAVVALGRIDRDDAVQRLVELAVNPIEHDGIRTAALTALPDEQVRALLDDLAEDPSPAVAGYARKLREGPTDRLPVPGHVPLDPTATQEHCDCSERCRCC